MKFHFILTVLKGINAVVVEITSVIYVFLVLLKTKLSKYLI